MDDPDTWPDAEKVHFPVPGDPHQETDERGRPLFGQVGQDDSGPPAASGLAPVLVNLAPGPPTQARGWLSVQKGRGERVHSCPAHGPTHGVLFDN